MRHLKRLPIWGLPIDAYALACLARDDKRDATPMRGHSAGVGCAVGQDHVALAHGIAGWSQDLLPKPKVRGSNPFGRAGESENENCGRWSVVSKRT